MGWVGGLHGKRVYLDANVFIYALSGFPAFAAGLTELFDAIDAGDVSAVTSELTVAEVLIAPLRRGDVEEERRCRTMLHPRPGLERLPVTMDVLESMARMRAKTPAIRTPDAIHAATSQFAGCDAFVTNDERFKAVSGLSLVLLSEVTSASPK